MARRRHLVSAAAEGQPTSSARRSRDVRLLLDLLGRGLPEILRLVRGGRPRFSGWLRATTRELFEAHTRR